MIAKAAHIEAVEKSPAFRAKLKPRLTRYIPNRPTLKQRAAMCLNHVTEVFYGGAAGGGKSDWLLMEALQYVDIPDYRAKIFRLTLSDADNEDSIMFRANEWLSGTDAKKEKSGTRWRFPSGATLSFGGMDQRDDHLKQQGAQFSFLGFDELTQFKSFQFEYVINSRLRKPGCSIHSDVRDPDCRYCQRYMHTNLFPLRIRCAANPGGRSHIYVKNRYRIGAVPGLKGPTGKQLYAGRFIKGEYDDEGEWIPPRPHIPAFVHDNPFLDKKRYLNQMRQMSDPVTREQLLSGDWGVTADGRFRMAWVKRYEKQTLGHIYLAGKSWAPEEGYEFIIVDPASSTKDTPGRTNLGKKSSWTVVSRWKACGPHLALMHVRRFQDEMPVIIAQIKAEMAGSQRVRFVGMEHTTQSIFLYQECTRQGLPMRPFMTGGKDKVARSFDAANRMEQGQIWLPLQVDAGPWLKTFEEELFTWTGADEETDDQVDVTSYAGIHMTSEATVQGGGVPIAF